MSGKYINTLAGRFEFLDAVDIVCAECHYGADEVCKDCPVRKTTDKIQEVPCVEEN